MDGDEEEEYAIAAAEADVPFSDPPLPVVAAIVLHHGGGGRGLWIFENLPKTVILMVGN